MDFADINVEILMFYGMCVGKIWIMGQRDTCS